jgi:hypothetical protein
MGESIRVNVKTPKKRAAVTGDLVGVRVQPQMAKELDDWRRKQADLPNRPEAIRRLVELALKNGNSLHGRKPQQPVDAKGECPPSKDGGGNLWLTFD